MSQPISKPAWSRLGLGTGTLASLGRSATFSEVDRLIGTMLDLGVSVIDTADTYGSGACERLLGRVLRNRSGSFIIVTKAGYLHADLPFPLRPLNPFMKKALQKMGRRQSFDPAYVSKCLDRSLIRLGIEHVSAFMLHDPTLAAVMDDQLIAVLENLKDSGKTIRTGISSSDTEVLKQAISTGIFDVVQTPASLRYAQELLPIWLQCEATGIQLIGNHIFDPLCFKQPQLDHETLMRAGASLLPAHATILCGTRNTSHLIKSNDWALHPLPAEVASQLASLFPTGSN